MAMFAREKETFLRKFLKLERGLPSHDTFSRIFRVLDPEQLRGCFQRFMARFAESRPAPRRNGSEHRHRSRDRSNPLHESPRLGCRVAIDCETRALCAMQQLLT